MKFIVMFVTALFTGYVYASGSIGGGGLGKEQLIELENMLEERTKDYFPIDIPDLGLEKLTVDPKGYRRTLLRLSIMDQTSIRTSDGIEISVKSLDGGIVDLEESTQIIVSPIR